MPERRHCMFKKDLEKFKNKLSELGYRAVQISNGSESFLSVNKGGGASDDACCYPTAVEIYNTDDKKLAGFLRRKYWFPF